jgi:hypothetical protein
LSGLLYVALALLLAVPAASAQSTQSGQSDRGTGAAAAPPTQAALPADVAPPGPMLIRVTSSFEVHHAGAVLRQVAKLFSAGFVRKDAEQVAKLIDSLAAEESRSWEFNAVRKGVSYPLRVRARIDEFGMLDLDFFTAPVLAPAVRSAVDGYLNARGL